MRAENEKVVYWEKTWRDTHFKFSTDGFSSNEKNLIFYINLLSQNSFLHFDKKDHLFPGKKMKRTKREPF